jgi:hypothetical protein
MCRSLEKQKVKKFYRKTVFLGTKQILQKSVYLRKNLGNFLTQEIYPFSNQRKIPLLLIPFARNFEEIFLTLIRDGAIFFWGGKKVK